MNVRNSSIGSKNKHGLAFKRWAIKLNLIKRKLLFNLPNVAVHAQLVLAHVKLLNKRLGL